LVLHIRGVSFREVGVELADVRPVEFDHIDVDERDVLPILTDAVASRGSDLLEILRKVAGGQGASERIAAGLDDRGELVEQRAEDGLFVRKVVVEIPGRHSGRVGNLTHCGGAEALMREKLQGSVENLSPALFGSELTLHLSEG